jgi:3-mercaptopyruvate sulfurtransferase SseA
MHIRKVISILLVLLGGILAVLPLSARYTFTEKPRQVLTQISGDVYLSVDEVARMVVNEDSTLQLIDVRPAIEFNAFSIPGSVNIPYGSFFEKDPEPFLNRPVRVVFYSNGDMDANYALVLSRGLGYENTFVMKGGLNEWFGLVMNSEFTGDRISPRENALFETRHKARKLCRDINSLPDSLKLSYRNANRFDPKKLDGGCE